MAPAPPTRRRSDCPKVDSQQEPGKPRRSNLQREGGQAPLRLVYRRFCLPNARRDAKKQGNSKRANRTDRNTRPKHRPNPPTKTQTEPRPPHQKQKARNTKRIRTPTTEPLGQKQIASPLRGRDRKKKPPKTPKEENEIARDRRISKAER